MFHRVVKGTPNLLKSAVTNSQNLPSFTVHLLSIAVIMKTTLMLLLALSLVVSNVAALPATGVSRVDSIDLSLSLIY